MKKSKKHRSSNRISKPIEKTNSELDNIFKSRTGGSINIRGLSFQLLYACKRIIFDLTEAYPEKKIRLEGIEDVDIINVEQFDFIQLKTSINPIDAGKFWDMGVLQNFLKVHLLEPNSRFTLVHNSSFSKGHLANLAYGKLTESDKDYWAGKLNALADINVSEFLNKITFQKETEEELFNSCLKQLVEKFNLDVGNYERYFQALYHNVFFWSRDRETITWRNLQQMIQEVTDSFSKAPINLAIQNKLIKKVAFEDSILEDDSYFEGKAAKPIHIIQGLPIRRLIWEKVIEDSIDKFDVTIIKSSSGQGKSTLAWCVANSLHKLNYTIYQLEYCKTQEDIAGLYDFLITRLKIGEHPLLIIDGLNNIVSDWDRLSEKLYGFPLKIVVTARQEDWYRYGCVISKVRLNLIDVFLNRKEAEDLFKQLKSKGKIHETIQQWEPIWEKIESKGLLIEYIYLLTNGKMISERISEQIKTLNQEIGAAAKVEILRLISLADILNIKIQSKKLTDFIQSTIGFQTDRGETYKQLKQEYYLDFDTAYIEGLHPVRSQHLVNTLHETLPVTESLLSLFKLIDSDSIYDYFIHVPNMLSINNRQDFYDSVALIMSGYNFSDINSSFDGLMHSEPLNYWKQNEEIFNEVFNGGGIEVFIQDTIPYSKEKIIQNLIKSVRDLAPNLAVLSEKFKQLSPYEMNDSDVILFAKLQLPYLNKNAWTSYKGLGFIAKWYRQLNIPFSIGIDFNEESFVEVINQGNFAEISELCQYFITVDYPKYLKFTDKYKDQLISILKKETNSLVIEEIGKEINIQYLLTEDLDKTSEMSFSKIQTIFEILPFYEKYNTQAIVLPFPDEDSYEMILSESAKKMSPTNIKKSDKFKVHLNQIWYKTIMENYKSPTIFHWQSQAVQIRKESLEFVKRTVKYFESVIERNQVKITNSIKPVAEQRLVIGGLLVVKKNLPSKSKKYFSKALFPADEKSFNSWCFSLNNFVTQFLNIFQPDTEQARHVALLNLKESVLNLSEMHIAFDNIVNSTSEYFLTKELKEDELSWYARLRKCTSYYIEEFLQAKSINTTNAKNLIETWWTGLQFKKLQEIHSIIQNFGSQSKFTFHLPNKIEEKGKLKYLVIGVDWLGIENDVNDFSDVSAGLSQLANVDIDFFTLVYIKDFEALYGLRFSKEFFSRIRKVIEEDIDLEDGVFGNPRQINLDSVDLTSLNNITKKNIKVGLDIESYMNMIPQIWQLSLYRQKLDVENSVEKQWLIELEKNYDAKIKKQLEVIESLSDINEYKLVAEWTNKILKNEYLPTTIELVELLYKKVDSIKPTLFE